ncbi:MAG: hypothetical protein LBT48_09110 [Prevotellaceae bacterium]|jgi:hypothetical protein|nr:hypothetical protein [Prevotellaceae bacterium]
MATPHDFVPKNDRQFLGWLTLVVNYLKNKFSSWAIPESEQQHVEQLLADFAAAFEAYDNPQTSTRAALTAKKETRKAAEAGVRALLKGYVTYNPRVTDEDRNNMELPIHKTTRTHAHAPTTTPSVTVKKPAPGVVEMLFQDSESSKRAKPAGVHGAEIIWAILDAPPAGWDSLIHSVFDTHTPYIFTFTYEERGKTLYFALRWENTRGEKGPLTEIQSTIIP